MSAATITKTTASAIKLFNTCGRPILNPSRLYLEPTSATSASNNYITNTSGSRMSLCTTAITNGSASPTQTASADGFVLFERHDDKGVIILNRPSALNSINLDMSKSIFNQLSAWDADSQIRMVVIKSSSEKSFCAGGDVKSIIANGAQYGKTFFRHEYSLNNLIGCLSVPYVALVDGIIMGGGCGVSVHGNFRVITEKALFAMPETAIGLFPDIGASHFLNKLPGSLGLYFGLTGHRLRGRDLFKAGIATHFVPSDKIKTLEEELLRIEKPDLLKLDRVLQKHQSQWEDDYRKEFSLKPSIGRINSCFGKADSVEQIISHLEKDNSEWARKHLELLAKMSPTSLKLTFEQLRRGKSMTLPECLKMEYRMACRALDNHEFTEGVRALLVEKDNNPKWKPAKLADVKDSDIQAYFEPLPYNEELQL